VVTDQATTAPPAVNVAVGVKVAERRACVARRCAASAIG